MSRALAKSKRAPNEFYRTPASAVLRYMEGAGHLLPAGVWYEPAVGDGAIVRTVSVWLPVVRWVCSDISPQFGGAYAHDFLSATKSKPRRKVSHIMTNPPFSLAIPFAERALEICPVVPLLLRVGILETPGRRDFFEATRPAMFVLPNRPSFTGGGTDGAAYAWFLWGAGVPGSYQILPCNPPKVRR